MSKQYNTYDKYVNIGFCYNGLSLPDILYELYLEALEPDNFDKIDEFIRDFDRRLPELFEIFTFKQVQECYALEISYFIRSLVANQYRFIYFQVYQVVRNYIEYHKSTLSVGIEIPNKF